MTSHFCHLTQQMVCCSGRWQQNIFAMRKSHKTPDLPANPFFCTATKYVQKPNTMYQINWQRLSFSFAENLFENFMQTQLASRNFLNSKAVSGFLNRIRLFGCDDGLKEAMYESLPWRMQTHLMNFIRSAFSTKETEKKITFSHNTVHTPDAISAGAVDDEIQVLAGPSAALLLCGSPVGRFQPPSRSNLQSYSPPLINCGTLQRFIMDDKTTHRRFRKCIKTDFTSPLTRHRANTCKCSSMISVQMRGLLGFRILLTI